jgi:MFS family permease
VALLAAFLLVEGKIAADPLLPLSFLFRPRRVAALAAILVTAAASASSMFLVNLWAQQVRGLSAALTSLVLLPTVLTVVMGPIAARLIDRHGVRRVTAAGLVLGAVAMLLLSRLESWPLVIAGLTLFAVGGGLAFSGATVSVLADAPPSRSGVAGGLANTAMEVGPTLGLALLVALAATRATALADAGSGPTAATTGGYALALIAMAAIFVLTAIFYLITYRKDRT